MTRQCARTGRYAIETLLAAMILAACGTPSTGSTPGPDPVLQVVPLESTGAVRIGFVAANVSPGATIAGCGVLIEGCAGRLRMTFRLDPPSDGPVLYMRVYLHATNLIACLWSETAPFEVKAGVTSVIDVSLTRADRCGVPTTIATMAAVVEGPVQVASRQTWSIHYTFVP
jgi:hypothetical protein